MAAKREAKWGLTAKVAAAATVAELVLIAYFCSSLCCFPRRQSAGLWMVHAIWCSHQLKADFLPFLVLPRLGRFLLPRLIFLLFRFVLHVLLVLFL